MYYWANPFSPSINGSSEIGGRYSSGRPELNLECLQHVYMCPRALQSLAEPLLFCDLP